MTNDETVITTTNNRDLCIGFRSLLTPSKGNWLVSKLAIQETTQLFLHWEIEECHNRR
jgi:hypothetical protein